MARKKKSKKPKKAKKNKKHLPKRREPLQIVEYEISYEPIETYPDDIQEEIEELFYKMQDPKSAKSTIPHILELIDKYPSVPSFYNYLTTAYSYSGNKEKALFWVNETYRLFPDYLFARINVAHQYLRENEPDKVIELFNGKLDLKHIYPEQRFPFNRGCFISCCCYGGLSPAGKVRFGRKSIQST